MCPKTNISPFWILQYKLYDAAVKKYTCTEPLKLSELYYIHYTVYMHFFRGKPWWMKSYKKYSRQHLSIDININFYYIISFYHHLLWTLRNSLLTLHSNIVRWSCSSSVTVPTKSNSLLIIIIIIITMIIVITHHRYTTRFRLNFYNSTFNEQSPLYYKLKI